jgi:adenylate kinase
MNIALIGPSGVGKGTVAAHLVLKFNLRHLSTGDLLRENLTAQTALGLLARRYMDQGDLVPDEVVDAMIEERVRKLGADQGILLDGFPRTAYQAGFLDDLLKRMDRRLDTALYLKVADEEIINRLSGRRICRNCQAPYHVKFKPPANAGLCDICGGALYQRADDRPEIMRPRLKGFHRVTGPVVDYYHTRGRLRVVDAARPIDQVQQAVTGILEALQQAQPPAVTRQEIELINELIAPIAPTAASTVKAARRSSDLVLLGGPGSGKGTQAEQLSKQLKLPHIATGDLFRENLKEQTDLGQLAKAYMDRGELVPDDVTEAMVCERLSRPDARPGFILDGFPRTLPQAEALMDMLTTQQRRLAGVVYIHVSDQEIVNRLSGRWICRNCQTPYHLKFKPPAKPGTCDSCGGQLYQRDDDNPTTVRARLKTFHGQTEPLIEYYRQAGLLSEIDGEGAVAEVTACTASAAKSLAQTSSAPG